MKLFLDRPLCNRRAGTGPIILGYHAVLCWRCLSASLAILAATPLLGMAHGSDIFAPLGALLVSVGAFDGFRSYSRRWGTSNKNRALFGSCLGLGVAFCLAAIR